MITNTTDFLVNPNEANLQEENVCKLHLRKHKGYLSHLCNKEILDKLPENYFSYQKYITLGSRRIIVDFILRTGKYFNLHGHTISLAVYLIDKISSFCIIPKKKYSTAALAILWIAIKFHEIRGFMSLSSLLKFADGAVSLEGLVSMEGILLQKLKFNVILITPFDFLANFLPKTYTNFKNCKVLCESALLSNEIHKFLPSQIAASSIYISNKYYNNLLENKIQISDLEPNKSPQKIKLWSKKLTWHTGYTLEALGDCIDFLVSVVSNRYKET